MTHAPRCVEIELAQLLGALPPAPEAWVLAASELPLARAGLDDIAARAQADAAFREALAEDLERALERAGYPSDPALAEAVRRRLGA